MLLASNKDSGKFRKWSILLFCFTCSCYQPAPGDHTGCAWGDQFVVLEVKKKCEWKNMCKWEVQKLEKTDPSTTAAVKSVIKYSCGKSNFNIRLCLLCCSTHKHRRLQLEPQMGRWASKEVTRKLDLKLLFPSSFAETSHDNKQLRNSSQVGRQKHREALKYGFPLHAGSFFWRDMIYSEVISVGRVVQISLCSGKKRSRRNIEDSIQETEDSSDFTDLRGRVCVFSQNRNIHSLMEVQETDDAPVCSKCWNYSYLKFHGFRRWKQEV